MLPGPELTTTVVPHGLIWCDTHGDSKLPSFSQQSRGSLCRLDVNPKSFVCADVACCSIVKCDKMCVVYIVLWALRPTVQYFVAFVVVGKVCHTVVKMCALRC
jgi:hypothetical protein